MDTPVATPTTFGLRRVRGVRGAAPQWAVRWGLSVALVLGAFFGSMSCATSLAAGHGAHVAAPDTGADHGAHGSRTAAHATESSGHSDGERASSDGQAHPGMACVTSLELRVPDLVVSTDVRPTIARLVMTPPDCVSGPEPPVPRFS